MAWEIIERKDDATLWRTTDAEGRDKYEVTRDRDGIAEEPLGVNPVETPDLAWENYNEDAEIWD